MARADPGGYELATLGVIVFAFGGAVDAAWHTAFGIETSTNALLSPSHLTLGTGIALVVSGPLVAGSRRSHRSDLAAQLPAVLSLTALLCVFTFFSLFAGRTRACSVRARGRPTRFSSAPCSACISSAC